MILSHSSDGFIFYYVYELFQIFTYIYINCQNKPPHGRVAG